MFPGGKRATVARPDLEWLPDVGPQAALADGFLVLLAPRANGTIDPRAITWAMCAGLWRYPVKGVRFDGRGRFRSRPAGRPGRGHGR
jgi:hypothetical protein